MQVELDATESSVPIRILGLNEAGQESGNDLVVEDRTLPWLQDTEEEDAWGDWKAAWRDVIVVDREGRPLAVINLTEHDLGDARWYDGLRDFLLDAAD